MPDIRYDPDGDCIQFFENDDDYYGEWKSPDVTFYVSRKTGKVVGFVLTRVSALLKNSTAANTLYKPLGTPEEASHAHFRQDT